LIRCRKFGRLVLSSAIRAVVAFFIVFIFFALAHSMFGAPALLCLSDDSVIRAENDVERVFTFRALMGMDCNIIAESKMNVGMGAHLLPNAACFSALFRIKACNILLDVFHEIARGLLNMVR
jgi:hypothetical protein